MTILNNAARGALRRFAFDHYLRTGLALSDSGMAALADYERKFNPNHDPANGRFTSGPGGHTVGRSGSVHPAKKDVYYQGRTAEGLGRIEPTSGGYVDANGSYVPEMFPPDPYAIKDPVQALQHYMDGSGTPMNFYLNGIDTSDLNAKNFKEIERFAGAGRSGTYSIVDALGGFDTTAHLTPAHLTEGGVLGGLSVSASGSLMVNGEGAYKFRGWVRAVGDEFTFHPRAGRTPLGNFSNAVGEMIPGKPFHVFVIGTKPLEFSGQ